MRVTRRPKGEAAVGVILRVMERATKQFVGSYFERDGEGLVRSVRERGFVLNPDIQVARRTPPTFLVQAEDDPTDPVENSLAYYAALRKAGIPAEMHVYVKGGHAFGLRRTTSPITHWPELAENWLETIGMISK